MQPSPNGFYIFTAGLAGGMLADYEMPSRFMLFIFRRLIFVSTLHNQSLSCNNRYTLNYAIKLMAMRQLAEAEDIPF
jgi:hypothetical protein